MNVVNPSDDTSHSGNVSGGMNVVNSSDDTSHPGNVIGSRTIVNPNDDGNESGFHSSSLSFRDDPPVTDFFVDVRTLQKPKSHWLSYPRVLNSLVQHTGKCNFI